MSGSDRYSDSKINNLYSLPSLATVQEEMGSEQFWDTGRKVLM